MNFSVQNQHIHRGGSELRQNPGRYFYLKNIGWFLHIRGEVEVVEGLEVSDGVAGPFATAAAAKFFLLKLIYEERPDLIDKLRVTSKKNYS